MENIYSDCDQQMLRITIKLRGTPTACRTYYSAIMRTVETIEGWRDAAGLQAEITPKIIGGK